MTMPRIIAKLDVKPPYVVKPIHFEGLRKIGSPGDLAKKYYEQGADEIMYVDIVASLYQQKIFFDCIKKTADNVLVPLSVGGGVRSIRDFSQLLRGGADKVVINTYAIQENPEVINEASRIFGAQSVVVNIEAKRRGQTWECYSDCGRVRSGRPVMDWLSEVQERGAGEILLQSVDMDGRRRGFDTELIASAVDRVKIPVVAASGAGEPKHVLNLAREACPSGIAVASILHYELTTVADLKRYLSDNGVGGTI